MKTKKGIEYAVVDIETTGGYAAGSSITEIAILVHNGISVVQRYSTLVNPGRPIPAAISALTGIDDEMVAEAPAFDEVAGNVYDLLKDRVFVAHSVNFDFSFVRHQLERLGYHLAVPKLCTVRMSRKIRPGLRSYSLGKLCKTLQIPIENRHRAGGDAEATAILFSKLLSWDTEGIIPTMLKRNSGEQRLPPNLPKKDFDCLPSCPGVYYFQDRGGKVIYVGKAVDLKKRVGAHFTGNSPGRQRQHFMRTIHGIRFETCATELMALLLESMEIKRLWPAFNRALKRYEPKYGLYSYEDQRGYQRLAAGKLARHQDCIQAFGRLYDAVKALNTLVERFELDPRLCYFGYKGAPGDMGAPPADRPFPSPRNYNKQVKQALDYLQDNLPSFLILDKGRKEGEKSCIWVEKGNLYAMGYLDDPVDLDRPQAIREQLKLCPSNFYSMQLIYGFAEQFLQKMLPVAYNKGNLAIKTPLFSVVDSPVPPAS